VFTYNPKKNTDEETKKFLRDNIHNGEAVSIPDGVSLKKALKMVQEIAGDYIDIKDNIGHFIAMSHARRIVEKMLEMNT